MTSKPVETLMALNTKKERIFSRLQVTHDLIQRLPQNQEIFLARASDIQSQYSEFESIINKMTDINETLPKGDRIDVENAALAFDQLYYNIRATYEKHRNPVSATSPNQDTNTHPKLPDLHIPAFSGQYEQFPAFISLFNTLIHNRQYSDIIKFSYLKSLLVYPASQTIASIEFNEKNYKEAYDKLVARYSNKRIVASYHINKILQFKPFSADNANNFRAFLDTFEDNYNALKVLNIEDLADFLIVYLSLNVIDKNTRRLFENQLKEEQVPTFSQLSKFIKAQFRVAELCNEPSTKTAASKPCFSKSPNSRPKTFLSKSDHDATPTDQPKPVRDCPLCRKRHKLFTCPEFVDKDVNSRYAILKRLRLCFSCTGPHHLSNCQSSGRCQTCGSKKHNSMLHRDDTSPNRQEPITSSAKDTTTQVQDSAARHAVSCHTAAASQALLGTARGRIRSTNGQWYDCRIVIDPGSQINFITTSFAKKLNLQKCNKPLCVSGVGETSIPISKSEVICQIAPKLGYPIFDITARVVPNIVGYLPSNPISSKTRQRFSSLDLSDPDFHTPSQVDLLLGVQMYGEILSNPPMLIKDRPCAIHTVFGWILFGEIPSDIPPSSVTSLLTFDSLQEDLKRFWEMEEVAVVIPPNPENQYCEDHFCKTVKRDESGRYVISLPFNTNIPVELPSTRESALRRFKNLEARFDNNPEYKAAYATQMSEYIQLDHVRETKTPTDYIMTHHGVVRNSSTSTKLRIVFNGSEKLPGCNSLNDLLLTGPQLQTDIGLLIDNFRTYPIAITCDIKMMFRCIRLHEEDRKFVHFFWRFHKSQPITEYELTTLPFGLRCAPFEAQRVIVQLYQDEGPKFPLAQKCLKETYVDNVVTGAANIEEALQLYDQLVALHQSGGFQLRKFSSNCPQFLSMIPHELQEQPLHDFNETSAFPSIKVLGLKWDPTNDVLRYAINLQESVFTKRGILSAIARIYDINGYLSPVTFWAKYLLQCLWLRKIDWDEELPDDLKTQWSLFLNELPSLQEVRIPRCVSSTDVAVFQLISFSDASERGYGCVVYLRRETSSGDVQLHLIRARSKVAPLKTISINRLELNAALLASKVIESLSNLREKLHIDVIYCFSDSKDVLYWLQTPPYQLKIFVANRVVQILNVTKPNWWNYIPTKENPADCVSRGLSPKRLLDHSLYWNGPNFLRLKPSGWPITPAEPPENPLELKTTTTFLAREQPNDLLEYFNKFSCLVKLIRVLAFCLRFIRNCKIRKIPQDSMSHQPLTSIELNDALATCVRLSQQKDFKELIYSLQNNKNIKGALAKLSPFMSNDGSLRVGGRLKNAPISSSAKHPLLIHQNSHLATLICDYYHLNTLHGGPQLVQSMIHRKYWIPSLRNLVRKRIFRCITCFKSKVKPTPPLMADLPDFRVSQARAFQRVGVDYGGPFQIKSSSRRNAPRTKCWIALFVCPCTHAVHIEVVTDLTTDSFIATLDRFIARRGLPSHIYSDCGTNFVGAARKLQELHEFLRVKTPQISDHLTQHSIQWHFLPPASPHMGGLWESAIKSTKRHLLAVLQDHALTYEEFTTLLHRVEAVLNSRPICAISNSPSDNLDYLSPGHFLIGQPLLARPEDVEASTISLKGRWELLSRSLHHFWKRFYQEYLHTLTPRSKWYKPQENLKEGQLVILQERDSPVQVWNLARVIEPLPGPDGIVRVVRLKTATTTLIRPVHKVVPLPVGDSFH